MIFYKSKFNQPLLNISISQQCSKYGSFKIKFPNLNSLIKNFYELKIFLCFYEIFSKLAIQTLKNKFCDFGKNNL